MATSKTNWKKSKRHSITLPSGVEVEIELPSLPELLAAGEVPNELVPVALSQEDAIRDDKVDTEALKGRVDFNHWIVARMVKDPVLEPRDLVELPKEDVEMLVQFALRSTDTDAVGHHIGGLESREDFRRFRGVGEFDPLGAALSSLGS